MDMTTEMEFLANKVKPEVAAAIRAKCSHSEHEQLKVLLDNLLSSTKDIDDEETIDWLTWLIAGGSTPEEFSSTVRMYDKATTCGLVWTENFVAYRCRTCGISPCMSLCTECFQHGNHEGHDFILFRSETGGACDCGEINIIKESGCCSLHGPGPQGGGHQAPSARSSRSDSNPSSNEQSAPLELLSIANGMMPRLFLRLILNMREENLLKKSRPIDPKIYLTCKHSVNNNNNNNDMGASNLTKGHKFIKMLQGLSDMGVAMRQVMIHSLTKSHAYLSPCGSKELENQEFKTFLEELVYWTVKFEFPEDLICLLLSMRSDSAYKEAFTRAFILHYRLISETILNSTDPDKLCKHVASVSVQLFSIKQLAVKMVDQLNLLPLLVTTLRDMIECAMIPSSDTTISKPKWMLDCDHEIMKNNYYWPIKSDLKELLSHQPVAMKFFEDEKLLENWFEFLSRFQGMNLSRYIEKGQPHVEQESETHIGAFTAELEISATPMWTLLSHLRDTSTKNLTKRVIMHCWKNLVKWTNSVKLQKGEVSFHLPLHRNLSMFIHQGIEQQGLPIEDLLPPGEQLMDVAQQLIRLQSTFYQILGRLWSRNGTEVLNQAESYVNSLCCNSMIDADIFLLQAISGSVSRDELLKVVFEEFHLKEILKLQPSNDNEVSNEIIFKFDQEEQNTMLESCLLFLATLTSSKTNIGMSNENLMALEMSTLLCKGDKLHSELMELLPERCGSDAQLKNFEKVLLQVADYQAPRNMQQGKYIPKSSVWENLYDPIHTLLRSSNRSDFQASLDRFQEFAKHSKKYSSLTNLWPPFRIPRTQEKGPIPDPTTILSSNLILEMIFIILYKSVHIGNVPNFITSLAVYLLELALSSTSIQLTTTESGPSPFSLYNGRNFMENLSIVVDLSHWIGMSATNFPNGESMISLLMKLHSRYKGSSNSYNPTTFDINAVNETRIGDGAFFVSNLLDKIISKSTFIRELIMKEIKNPVVESSEQSLEKERDEKRRKAKERKLQLMTEFAMKRQQFMKEVKEDPITFTEELHGEQTVLPDNTTDCQLECVICMDKGGSKFENPYGLLTFITPSSVLGHRKCNVSRLLVENSEMSFKTYWESASQEFANHFDESSVKLSIPSDFGTSVCIRTCGHYLHMDCFNSYINSMRKARSTSSRRNAVKLSYKNFSCPLCRQLGNTFLPVIKDNLGIPSYENSEPDENELTRLIRKRNTLVLSPKQKQGVERFLDDLNKTIVLTNCDSSSSLNVNAQALSLVFLNSLDMELIRMKNPEDINRSFIFPFYSVLRYTYKSLSVGHGRKLAQIWETICGNRHPKGQRDVPVLLKDLNVLMTHLALQLPYGTEKKYLDLTVDRLCKLKLVQIIVGLCCQLEAEDLQQVKSYYLKDNQETRSGLSFICNRIIECIQKSVNFNNKCDENQLPVSILSNILTNMTELESYAMDQMRPFLRKISLLKRFIHKEEGESQLNTSGYFTWFQKSIDFSRLVSNSNFDKIISCWMDELAQSNEFLKGLIAPHLILWDEPKLIDIALEYDKIFQSYRKLTCQNCNSTPSEPALCLSCGTIVCLNSFCCLDKQSKASEVIHHSKCCGMGTSVFLCILSSAILIVVEKEACVWGSVFLDAYGEEDLDLKRGKPLFLSKERFSFLQKQWQTHSFLKSELKWFPHDNML